MTLPVALGHLSRRCPGEAAPCLEAAAADPATPAAHRALALHLLALLDLEAGRIDGVAARLASASTLERELGHEQVSLQTTHELALATQRDATLARVATYYRETLGNLRRFGTPLGRALCLKTVGEIALAKGRAEEASAAWARAAELLGECGDAAVEHVRAWVALLAGFAGDER